MAKPRILGYQKTYIPNNRADARRKQKIYQRGRDIAERGPVPSDRRIRKKNAYGL